MRKQTATGIEKQKKEKEQAELREENKRLSEENCRLRMENDYLKNRGSTPVLVDRSI